MKKTLKQRLSKLKILKNRWVIIGIVAALLGGMFYATRPPETGVMGTWEMHMPITSDAYVVSTASQENYGGDISLFTGNAFVFGTPTTWISYIDWARPDFGPEQRVIDVTLRLQQTAGTSGDLTAVCPIYSTSWTEGEITYALRPFMPTSMVQLCSDIVVVDSSNVAWDWNVTRLDNPGTVRIETTFGRPDSNSTATLFGKVWSPGWNGTTSVNFLWSSSLTDMLDIAGTPTPVEAMEGVGTFNYMLTGLNSSTQYFFRAFGSDEKGAFWHGDLSTFMTKSNAFPPPPPCEVNCTDLPPVDPPPEGTVPEAGPQYDPPLSTDPFFPDGPHSGVALISLTGLHEFSSKDHNRPEQRPAVIYTYVGPRILSPTESGQQFLWFFGLAAVAPVGLGMGLLVRRWWKAIRFHLREQWDPDAFLWLNRISAWDYDPRDYDVYGTDEEDELNRGQR